MLMSSPSIKVTFDDQYGPWSALIERDECWKCGDPNPDLAHAVWEYVAAAIGAELVRRIVSAVAGHEAGHGCVDQRSPWCPVTCGLWDLLPAGFRGPASGTP